MGNDIMDAMTTNRTGGRKRPSGRRGGDSGTRDAILDAARDLFAQVGYDNASLRAIAGAAGVDPALIRHFFGDKENLFATLAADRTTIPQLIAETLMGDPATAGHRLADTYLRLWEDPTTQPLLLALVRSASTSDKVAAMLRETLMARVPPELIKADPDRATRIALAGSHLFGLAAARHIIKMPAVADLPHDDLVAQVAPTIQRYLTATHI